MAYPLVQNILDLLAAVQAIHKERTHILKKLTQKGLGILGLLTIAHAAHAISFTSVAASVPSSSALIGTNGLLVQIPSHFLVGVGSKTATITYTVTASAGHNLTSVTLDPNGLTVGGSQVSVASTHPSDVTATFVANTMAATVLGSSVTPLNGTNNQYNVSTVVSLTGAQSGLAKVSVMQFFYSEAPVPEPATLGAIAIALSAIARRRKA